MNFFSKLFRRKTFDPRATTLNLEPPSKSIEGHGTADPSNGIRWIPAAENRFGVDVLDCSAFAQSMVSWTSDVQITMRFSELRGSQGEHCRGKDVNDHSVTCRLEYPSDRHLDGPVFRAEEMEDKWDIFLLDGVLHFSRSWTGDLVYKATIKFNDSQAIVNLIRGQREPGSSEDPVAVVDYLIKSHVYGLVVPHPLPKTDQASVGDLARWSFARYGRRGLFGTKQDVTHLIVRRNEDGHCSVVPRNASSL
jgi:hypothetical protein